MNSGDSNFYRYVGNSPISFFDPFGLLILPNDPSGLPDGWQRDPTHKSPNGEKWVYPPTGDELEWHPGQKDKPGWRGKDHWHHNKGKDHLPPGTEVPDPVESCNTGDSPTWQPNIHPKPLPWWYYLLAIPFIVAAPLEV